MPQPQQIGWLSGALTGRSLGQCSWEPKGPPNATLPKKTGLIRVHENLQVSLSKAFAFCSIFRSPQLFVGGCLVRPGPYELRVQYESRENGQETSKVAGPAWQLVAPMRHFCLWRWRSRSVQPCLARWWFLFPWILGCWCLLPALSTKKTKKMRLNRFYAAWLGPCHCFILAMIRLVGLSLCHNYLKLRDDGDLKCGPSLGVQGQHLPARSVTQLTVLSRLAGPIERWPETLLPQAREVDLWPLQTAFGLVSARGVTILQSSKILGALSIKCFQSGQGTTFVVLVEIHMSCLDIDLETTWEATLGYNMIHFTPIQPPGAYTTSSPADGLLSRNKFTPWVVLPGDSGSCYALDDQASFHAKIFLQASDGAQLTKWPGRHWCYTHGISTEWQRGKARIWVSFDHFVVVFFSFLLLLVWSLVKKTLVQRWKVVQQSVVSGWQSQGFGTSKFNPPVFIYASQESLENAGLLSAMDIVLNHCAGHVNLLIQRYETSVLCIWWSAAPNSTCRSRVCTCQEVHLGFWNSQSLHITSLGFPKALAGPKHSHDFISLDFHQPKDLCHLFLPATFGVCFSMSKNQPVFFVVFVFPSSQWPEVRNCPHLTAASELDLKLELSSAWPERSTSFMTGPPNHLIRPYIFLKGVRKGGGWQVDWPLWLVNLEFFRIRNLDLGK